MNKLFKTLLFFGLWCCSFLDAAERADRWSVEADLGGAAGLGSSAVRKDGKTGLSVGGLVRFSQNGQWDSGFGYNVLSLQNGFRLRPATFVGDRRLATRGNWAPYIRAGAGIGADNSSGSLNRFVARGGIGAKRSMGHQWDLGLVSELWLSPKSGDVSDDMVLLTVGVTLSRSFARRTQNSSVEKPKPRAPAVAVSSSSVPLDGGAKPSEPTRHLLAIPKPIHVLFPFDRWDQAKSDLQTKIKDLEKAAQFMLDDITSRAEVHGHADTSGPLGYNIALSRKRAKTVKDFIVDRWKIAPARFSIFAHGSHAPIASNATREGRAKNRRATVIVIPSNAPNH